MSTPDPVAPITRNEPLREAVYARIVTLLSTGRLSPGMSVTEAALSRSLDVSRTPVREALLRLEAEGVVHSSLARGFVVRPLSDREVSEVYPILAALEALAVRSAPRPLETAEHDRLAGLLDELEASGDAVARRALDTAFHTGLISLCGNQHLQEAIAKLRTSLSRYEIAYMQHTLARSGGPAAPAGALGAGGGRPRARGSGHRGALARRQALYRRMALVGTGTTAPSAGSAPARPHTDRAS